MRLATIITPSGPRLHVRARGGYVDIGEATSDPRLASLRSFLEAGPAAADAARGLLDREGTEYQPADFGPAVPAPERILCLGLNYSEHAIEGGRAVPSWPDAFIRGRETVLGPFADLPRPALSEAFDYEGELGVVIGAGGRYIPAGKALDAIAGFTVLNDASVRDWQRAATQWTAGKNFDATMPIGPEIVTPDEADVSDVALTTTLNGQVMQSARTSQMLVDVPSTIEFFSSFTTLRPGDVIATGTPGGVGFARKPPVWMKPGDIIEITVEGVGTIRNRVVAEEGDRGGWRWRPGHPATGGL
ncbi:MAG: fumarylacetoacetate hydrolase family protein [Streptosporangiaceae bacterium]|nr:fumarylacetoacetate hydrolase family protein [Streptosporangiaceae bacterium]MBV9857661.1 fumarylacetoacetate hydrolase family protein [Streptosporangiaceae bacterium]